MRHLRFVLFLSALWALAVGATTQGQEKRTIVSPQVQENGKISFNLLAPKAQKVVLSSSEMQPYLKTSSFPMIYSVWK